MPVWSMFQEEDGKVSFSRIVGFIWFFVVTVVFAHSYATGKALPESYDNLTYTFFGSYVAAKYGQAWLRGRKATQ